MAPNDFCYLDYYQTKDPMKEPLGIGGFVPVSKSYALDPYNGLAPEERITVPRGRGSGSGCGRFLWFLRESPHKGRY